MAYLHNWIPLRWGRAALGLVLTFAALPVFAQGPQLAPSARAVKASAPPALDGNVLDDPAWRDVVPITDFWQTAPDAGQPASERTEVRIVYTSSAIFFGVVLRDSSPSLTVSDSRRDSPLDDTDSFRILLDTYRDRQNGFV